MVFGGLQVAEIKQFDDELAIVVLLELRQLLDAVFGIILLCLVLFSTIVRRKVVFPVPAFPVRNMLVPVCSTKSQALLSSGFFSVAIDM